MRMTGVVIALLAFVWVLALAAHDGFYGELGVNAAEVGLGQLEMAVRAGVYLAAYAVAATLAGVVVAAVAMALVFRQRLEQGGQSTRAAATAGAYGAGAAIIFLAPGFRAFLLASTWRLAAFLVLLAAAAALVTRGLQPREHHPSDVPSTSLVSGLAAAVVVPALALAYDAGQNLAAEARAGNAVRADAFDPLSVSAEPVCVEAAGGPPSTAPTPAGKHSYLGQEDGIVILHEIGPSGGAIRLPADEVRLSESRSPCPGAVGGPPKRRKADEDLAREVRPVLLFDSAEPWRPISIDAFLAERFDGDGRHQLCYGPRARRRCNGLRSAAGLNAERKAWIDVHGGKRDGSDYRHAGRATCRAPEHVLDCEDETSAIYYRVTRRKDRAYVDFWWFLRFNHFPRPFTKKGPCGGRWTPMGWHEGDWEGVTVVVALGPPNAIVSVVFSAHGHSFRYIRRGLERRNGRPVVYVACGSHAAYPEECVGNGCRQTRNCSEPPCRPEESRLAEASFDGRAEWARNDDKECFTEPDSPCLLGMPDPDRIPADRPTTNAIPWTIWSGLWGRKKGPRSPGWQARFRHPDAIINSYRVSFEPSWRAGKSPERVVPSVED